MAIIKFENSKDLINYLCKEDVLGKLKVSFTSEWSSELTPSFNFYYSDLDEHLSNIFSQWLQETRSAPSEIHVVFTNVEDFSIEAVENFEYNETEKKYAKEIIIYDSLGSILDEELELQFENAHIEIVGPDFNLKNLKIKRFEIKEYEHKNKEVSLEQVDERIPCLVEGPEDAIYFDEQGNASGNSSIPKGGVLLTAKHDILSMYGPHYYTPNV